jgi:two-component system response regulator FixJ
MDLDAGAGRHVTDEHLSDLIGRSDINGAEQLTSRERDVLDQVIAGASNKEAGRTLGISPRTVEVHRAHIMAKLGAKNAPDLVRIVLGQGPPR